MELTLGGSRLSPSMQHQHPLSELQFESWLFYIRSSPLLMLLERQGKLAEVLWPLPPLGENRTEFWLWSGPYFTVVAI